MQAAYAGQAELCQIVADLRRGVNPLLAAGDGAGGGNGRGTTARQALGTKLSVLRDRLPLVK
jgi:hypothetical protein